MFPIAMILNERRCRLSWAEQLALKRSWIVESYKHVLWIDITCQSLPMTWVLLACLNKPSCLLPIGGHSITIWTRRGGGRGDWISSKSMLGHVTKSRCHLKLPNCPFEGGGGQNWVKFGPCSCWMTPCINCYISCPLPSIDQFPKNGTVVIR